MTKLQILALLLASIALIFFTSCDGEDFQEPDVYKVTPDLRARINMGMKLPSKSEKKQFNEKFDLFLVKCEEMAYISNPHVYMETTEYQEFKDFVLSASPNIYYLVMDKFLKGNPGFFSYIIYDLLIDSKPAIADQISEKMKAVGTLEESFYLYPQLCLDIWVDALENQ
ncbi:MULTISPECIES: hypothetical protein [Parabacteroides]|uniref:hypothetical protein n=1 Tax=Parabacteroides leei TaxID=2939491 RepID=UPI001896CDA8|nr:MULTISPECIES: hypothetical protein [Parabacteroides]MCL3850474.1 hypothetical protein [Parabacteroides leei]